MVVVVMTTMITSLKHKLLLTITAPPGRALSIPEKFHWGWFLDVFGQPPSEALKHTYLPFLRKLKQEGNEFWRTVSGGTIGGNPFWTCWISCNKTD